MRVSWLYHGVARTSILGDVYYIQGINLNLMSLGQFNTNGGDEGSLEWHRVLRIARQSTSLTQRRKTIFTELRFERRVDPQLGKASTNPSSREVNDSTQDLTILAEPGCPILRRWSAVHNKVLSKLKIEQTSNKHRKGVQTFYLILSWLARECDTILAISVPSEPVFSVAGEILTKRRSALAPKAMIAVMFSGSWLGLT